MKKQKEKMPLKNRIVFAFAALALAIVVFIFLSSVKTPEMASSPNDVQTSAKKDNKEKQEDKKDKVIYEDEQFKVTFMGLEDDTFEIGMFYTRMKVENNSDNEILVVFDEAYVNDTSIQLISGFPLDLQPGKNAVASNGFYYTDKGFDKLKDIKKMEFRIIFKNGDTLENILETDNIVLEF